MKWVAIKYSLCRIQGRTRVNQFGLARGMEMRLWRGTQL